MIECKNEACVWTLDKLTAFEGTNDKSNYIVIIFHLVTQSHHHETERWSTNISSMKWYLQALAFFPSLKSFWRCPFAKPVPLYSFQYELYMWYILIILSHVLEIKSPFTSPSLLSKCTLHTSELQMFTSLKMCIWKKLCWCVCLAL